MQRMHRLFSRAILVGVVSNKLSGAHAPYSLQKLRTGVLIEKSQAHTDS